MHASALKSILALTACALGAVAAADASAQTAVTEPSASQNAAAGQADAQQPAPEESAQAVPHAKILGAVNIQGNLYRQRELLPGENTQWIGSLADCLAQADGWLQNAAISRVHILRANAAEDTPPTIVNFRRYLEQGNSDFNPPIYVNDTIYIPEAGNSETVNVQTIRQIETRYYSTHAPYGYYYPQGPSVYIIQTPPPPRRPHKPGHPNTPPQQPPRPRPRPPRPQPPQPAEPERIRVVPAGTRQQVQQRRQSSSRQTTTEQAVQRNTRGSNQQAQPQQQAPQPVQRSNRQQTSSQQPAREQTIRVTPNATGQQTQPQSGQQRGTLTPVRSSR